jgi:membrane protein required for colicin V production
MDLGLTWFDFAALAVLGLSGVMAFARGLIREVFSIIAFIGAGIAAVFFHGMAQPLIERFTPLSGILAAFAAGLAIFLVVFVAITLITSTLAKTAHQSTEIGSFDRAAGLAFGILRGVVVVALFVLPVRQMQTGDANGANDPVLSAITGARTYPMYNSVAGVLEAVLPQARQRVRDTIERRRGESTPIPPAEEPAPQPAPQN